MKTNKRLDLPSEQEIHTVQSPAYELGETQHFRPATHYGVESGKSGKFGLNNTALVAGGVALAVAGGVLAYRSATKSRVQSSGKGVEVDVSQTVKHSPEAVYAFWRKLENLPRFMHHLKEVRELDSKRSHWAANVPGDFAEVSWEAEIVAEEPGRFIAWRSLPGSQVENSGEVRFESAPGNMIGTRVHAIIAYHPPMGAVGTALAGLFKSGFKGMVKDDLRRFKNIFETANIPAVPPKEAPRL